MRACLRHPTDFFGPGRMQESINEKPHGKRYDALTSRSSKYVTCGAYTTNKTVCLSWIALAKFFSAP